ncbi:MAG: hypothetical protein R3F61_04885 [Myxococcota bacterium]
MSGRFWLGTIVLVWALACVGAPPEGRGPDDAGAPVSAGSPVSVEGPGVRPSKGAGRGGPAQGAGHGEAMSGSGVSGSPTSVAEVQAEGSADAPEPGGIERTEVLLDRQVLERDLASVEAVSEVIGLRPNLTLRGIDGFEVTDLPPGSPLAGIGLQRGDVVHSVNGHELTSLQAALEAGEALQDAAVLEGVITRDGRERTLVVRLE